MIKEFGTKREGLERAVSMEDRRVLSIAHTEKAKAVLGREDGEGMWEPSC